MKTSLMALLLCVLYGGLIACGERQAVAPPAAVPAEVPAEAPADVALVDSDAPADVGVSTDSDAPANVDASTDVDVVADTDTSTDVDVPTDVDTSADAAAPVDISAPVNSAVSTPVDVATPSLVLADIPVKLKPYTAIYSSSFNGMDAEMERSLKQTADNHWQLRNSASILFFELEEKAQFSTTEGVLTPLSYDYRNKLSSKRNSKLQFNASEQSAFDSLHSKKPLLLPANSFDKLSYQTQLRMELLQNQGQLRSETFHLVDRTKVKSYQFSQLGTELLDTPAGRFNSVKLSQSRTGKDEHTLIWLATDWDYFVLRIQRVEDGKIEFQVDLNSASIDGEAIKGL